MRQIPEDYGHHKGARRQVVFDTDDFGPNTIAQTIAAAGFIVSGRIWAGGFTHFFGMLDATSALGTTLVVQVQPNIVRNSVFPSDNFTVATLAAVAAPRRFPFAWGEARGLLVGALGTGSNYIFSEAFRIIVRNTGANPATDVTLIHLECS